MLANTAERKRLTRIVEQARRLIERESPATATRALRKLLAYSLDIEDRASVSLLLAEGLVANSDYSGALEVLSQEHGGEYETQQNCLRAYCLALAGKPKLALEILLPQLRTESGLCKERADCLLCVGISFYRLGHYQWARKTLTQAAAMYRLLSHDLKLAHCLIDMALIEKNTGRHRRALGFLEEAADLIRGRKLPRTRLTLLQNRGICLLQLGQLAQARVCFLRADEIARESGNEFILVGIHNNLGHLFRLQGNHSLAAEFYDSALHGARRIKARRKECLSLEFLAENHNETGKHALALDLLDSAYSIARSNAGHGDLIGEILRRRGEARAGVGDLNNARRDLQQAVAVCESRGEVREQLLATRSVAVLIETRPAHVKTLLTKVLNGLEELGDRFEFSRTVLMAMSRPELKLDSKWITPRVESASHYFRAMGSTHWHERLQAAVGASRQIRETHQAAAKAHWPTALRSRSFKAAMEEADIASRGRGPICIFGESGSGKEVMARAIHQMSSAKDQPMIAINCGAMPEQLVESELFGHRKGSFTGSTSDKPGLLETASRGMVLLDEIGELPLTAQVKLLRFLDSGEYRRVGETSMRRTETRVLAATNRDLQEMVDRHEFRADLWFRLSTFQVRVPPLRERREDILYLFNRFLVECSDASAKITVTNDLEAWLLQYDWPGNVRELRNIVDYLIASSWGAAAIDTTHLPRDLRNTDSGRVLRTLGDRKSDLERTELIDALRKYHGRVSDTAAFLGVGRNTVTRKMKGFNLRREDFKPRV